MKKKLVAATLTASMILSMGVATVPVMAKDDGEPYKVALLLNGTLGSLTLQMPEWKHCRKNLEKTSLLTK